MDARRVAVGSYWHSGNASARCSYYVVTDLLADGQFRVVYVCRCHLGHAARYPARSIATDDLILEGEQQ